MARPRKPFPAYPGKAHASGRAVIRLDGDDIYLAGPFDSPESHEDYERRRAERFFAQRGVTIPPAATGSLRVADVAAAYIAARENEQSAHELYRTRLAMQLLLAHHAELPASEFGAAELESLGLQSLKDRPCPWCKNGVRGKRPCKSCGATGRQRWARHYVNRFLAIIKACWDWAVRQRMVAVSPLRSVRGIRRGIPGARETKPVRSVPRAVVVATQKHCGRILRDLIELQYLTGMRPEEVCGLKREDIATDGVLPEVGSFAGTWVYDVKDEWNKNAWRDQGRVVFFGPRAQKLLKPYLKRDANDHIFDPREAEREHLEKINRPQRQNRPKPPGPHYRVGSLCNAVKRACRRAGVESWTLLRVRHLRATEIRSQYGSDEARVVLGHHLPGITGRYAEADLKIAAKVMREIG